MYSDGTFEKFFMSSEDYSQKVIINSTDDVIGQCHFFNFWWKIDMEIDKK